MENDEGYSPPEEQSPDAEELESKGHVLFSPSTVVFALSPEHRRQAAKCLQTNGEIRISFRDIAVTDLTGIRLLNGDGDVIVD
jgi:hypothetical protein